MVDQAIVGELTEEQSFKKYYPLVKNMAFTLCRSLPLSIQLEDITQAGSIGLLDAIRRYDSSQGAALKTFASIRIHGSMLDELRNGDIVSKNDRTKAKEISKTKQQLLQSGKKKVTNRNIAEALGMSLDQVHSVLNKVNICNFLSYEEIMGNIENGVSESLNPICQRNPTQTSYTKLRLDEVIARNVNKLTERQRKIFLLQQDKGLSAVEISRIFNISESRVSQEKTLIEKRLREALKDYEHPDAI